MPSALGHCTDIFLESCEVVRDQSTQVRGNPQGAATLSDGRLVVSTDDPDLGLLASEGGVRPYWL